jgi:hypothetical protein
MRKPLLVFACAVATVSAATAQTVETDPLQCWWRTSTGAVRVGEPFSVVLTCAVLETDAATVVVDAAKLEPSVVQFAPFEVLGGAHGADLRTDLRRFFQYEYRLRLIAENEFGKDVALPETKLSYHVQSRVGQNAAIQGREQSYVLPAQSIRILSLVPGDAADIRDTPAETFADLDQRAFRANLFKIVGGVLFVLAGLLALLALVRLFSRFRKKSVDTNRLVSDGAILGAAGGEFRAVQREREQGGWTPELAARALTALRVAATYALRRPVAQSPLAGTGSSDTGAQSTISNQRISDVDGILIVRHGWPRTKQVAISGAVTARSLANETKRGLGNAQRAALLDSLEQALAQFTTAQYGRDVKPDDAALDEALAAGRAALKRIRLEQTWVMKKFGRRPPPREVEARAWSR